MALSRRPAHCSACRLYHEFGVLRCELLDVWPAAALPPVVHSRVDRVVDPKPDGRDSLVQEGEKRTPGGQGSGRRNPRTGVDRSGDALKHANHTGIGKTGGVVAVVGDLGLHGYNM